MVIMLRMLEEAEREGRVGPCDSHEKVRVCLLTQS
jgi:hypothetical protein